MTHYQLEAYAPRLADGSCCWMIDLPLTFPALARRDGKRIKRWNSNIIAVYPEAPAEFDYGEVGVSLYPIFSSRLRAFFDASCPGLIHFLSIRLERDDGAFPLRGYCLGKFLTLIDCIDRTRTKVDNGDWTPSSSGDFNVCGPVVLRKSRIQDARCFVVRGASQYIVIREDLRRDLEAEDFKGLSFEDLRISRNA